MAAQKVATVLSYKLICPEHRSVLELDQRSEVYFCPAGCKFPSLNDIPRFVQARNYAASFGLQWNTFRKTQLDSHTGTSISRDRLTRLAGGSLDVFRGKDVLEAGCGAGRFTEVMLAAGGRVFAADISTAVEANYENCHRYPDYFVCQADIRKLPMQPETFDVVVCVGVIQHTPDPEQTMSALCSYLKPGGLLILDHYSENYPTTPFRQVLRKFLLGKPEEFSMSFSTKLVSLLWPVHRLFWRAIDSGTPKARLLRKVRSAFLYLSPVVDYHDGYPQLGPGLLRNWAVLDTHDTLTDFYKHLRSREEIVGHLQSRGMSEIEAAYAGNGVEVRARKLGAEAVGLERPREKSDLSAS